MRLNFANNFMENNLPGHTENFNNIINEQTVFIVDDEPDVRAALRLLIKSVGYNVECFATADEFFNQFAT